MADFQFIKYEKADHIVTVTINRPEVLNALNPPTSRELYQAWQDFDADDDAWVAILTGAGERAFCAGMDLRWRAEQDANQSESLLQTAKGMPGGWSGLTNRRSEGLWKPIIAAINGYALGGGLEVAMACDIIVAAETARLGQPEPLRGIMAGAGGVHRLPRMIPLKVAMGYLLTGKQMTAAEAERWGLVNEVVPAADLMAAAERWARAIIECAPLAVRATKQAAMQGLDMSLDEALNTVFPTQQVMTDSADAREGPAAFSEKRKPVWQGK